MTEAREVSGHTLLWRRLDEPGHESARLSLEAGRRVLGGAAAFAHRGAPCRLDYWIECDAAWRTVSTVVGGWIGDRAVAVEIRVDRSGRWRMNGEAQPQVEGCVDVDLNFSPSTNLLPIRRLGLAVGEEAEVATAWLRFPTLALERLPQLYRRTGERAYRYESNGGAFASDIEVNDAGFVTRYPGLWEAVAEG